MDEPADTPSHPPAEADAPPEPRRRRLVALTVFTITLVTTIALLVGGPAARLEARSRITMFTLGLLDRDHDVVLRNVDVAHAHLNLGVWGSVSTARARSSACDRLHEAQAHAERRDYSDTEREEISAVAAIGCQDDGPLREFHDIVAGLEVYLRTGQGRLR